MDTPNYELKNCDMNCCEGSKVWKSVNLLLSVCVMNDENKEL